MNKDEQYVTENLFKALGLAAYHGTLGTPDELDKTKVDDTKEKPTSFDKFVKKYNPIKRKALQVQSKVKQTQPKIDRRAYKTKLYPEFKNIIVSNARTYPIVVPELGNRVAVGFDFLLDTKEKADFFNEFVTKEGYNPKQLVRHGDSLSLSVCEKLIDEWMKYANKMVYDKFKPATQTNPSGDPSNRLVFYKERIKNNDSPTKKLIDFILYYMNTDKFVNNEYDVLFDTIFLLHDQSASGESLHDIQQRIEARIIEKNKALTDKRSAPDINELVSHLIGNKLYPQLKLKECVTIKQFILSGFGSYLDLNKKNYLVQLLKNVELEIKNTAA